MQHRARTRRVWRSTIWRSGGFRGNAKKGEEMRENARKCGETIGKEKERDEESEGARERGGEGGRRCTNEKSQ
jgi:hypothetical protein